jgi:hypothetical protein
MTQSSDQWLQLKTKFPDEAAVYLDRSELLTIIVVGDSLRVKSEVAEDMLHLKQTDIFTNKKVYGSHFSQIANLQAKTLVWEKNKYKSIEVSDFKKNSDQDRGIFFDDSYHYTFDFPAVALRNRTQLSYQELQKDPRFISGFVFGSYSPQVRATYSIKTTTDVELFFEVLNDHNKAIQFKKVEKGKNVTYTWTAENLPAMSSDDQSPSIRYFAPHVVCYVKSYYARGKKVEVLTGLPSLHTWYQTFVRDINKETSGDLQGIVDKIKQNSVSDDDVVRNIFYWVQDNIQYIAFEQGMRGFIPNSGSYTCEKRYGDCKDMANLIVNMVQLAGLKSYHTWIGSRDLPYKYSEFPTPIVDNHMIATYISSTGKYYFLDATSDYTPFGFPSSMIQGKEALISLSPTTYEVKIVPVVEKEQSLMTDTVTVRVDNNQLIGSGKCTLSGFAKVFSTYELDRSEADDVKRFITRLVGKGSNKFYLDNYTVVDVMNRDKPTQVIYDFKISDYFQKAGAELYINLNLKKDYYNNYINAKTRTSPKEIEYKYTEFEYTELIIPEGYTVEYIPENAAYEGTLLGYEIAYVATPDKITFSKKLYIDYLLMNTVQFETWNNEVKRISELYKESIIIKKK